MPHMMPQHQMMQQQQPMPHQIQPHQMHQVPPTQQPPVQPQPVAQNTMQRIDPEHFLSVRDSVSKAFSFPLILSSLESGVACLASRLKSRVMDMSHPVEMGGDCHTIKAILIPTQNPSIHPLE